MYGLNSERFQNFHFKPKLSLLRGCHKNDNQGKFLDSYEFYLCIIFKIFNGNSQYRKGRFQENRENHI